MNGGGESSSVLTNGSHIGGGDSFAVKTESKPLFSSAVKSGSSSAATAMVVNGAGNGEMNGELNGELNGQFNNGEVKVVESEDPSNDLSGEITVIPVEGWPGWWVAQWQASSGCVCSKGYAFWLVLSFLGIFIVFNCYFFQ